eukprot:TRINITY_DN1334_c0_g1_i1.p1 TRINITY_DN1334_c0_g1~~TRINITY_DN1334_c0_g1_i1.p1  ORF type:complete len:429 (+),score=168.29 TRINITY_DN1334_c0_g1_i1:3-1289(+)
MAQKEAVFTNRTFSLTGTFPEHSHHEIKDLITNNGGNYLKNNPGPNIDYLLATKEAVKVGNSMVKKAKKEEVPIVSIDFVLDSIKADRLLDIEKYLLVENKANKDEPSEAEGSEFEDGGFLKKETEDGSSKRKAESPERTTKKARTRKERVESDESESDAKTEKSERSSKRRQTIGGDETKSTPRKSSRSAKTPTRSSTTPSRTRSQRSATTTDAMETEEPSTPSKFDRRSSTSRSVDDDADLARYGITSREFLDTAQHMQIEIKPDGATYKGLEMIAKPVKFKSEKASFGWSVTPTPFKFYLPEGREIAVQATINLIVLPESKKNAITEGHVFQSEQNPFQASRYAPVKLELSTSTSTSTSPAKAELRRRISDVKSELDGYLEAKEKKDFVFGQESEEGDVDGDEAEIDEEFAEEDNANNGRSCSIQ